MKYVIASRGSKLALCQAQKVEQRLRKLFPEHEWQIQTFTTTGDRVLNKPLAEFGGKGVFLKEIEEALLAGTVHLAVHSLKDVPTEETHGLQLSAFLTREDPRDVWVSKQEQFSHLPGGKVVGTSSLRRQLLVRFYRTDLRVELLRGNLDTRLRKLNEGQYDGIVVAAAGLHRLELFDDSYMHYLSEDAFVPAPGQGILVVQTSRSSEEMRLMAKKLNDPISEQCGRMERKFLALFHGGCHLPVGALAETRGSHWQLRAVLGGVRSGKVIQDFVSHSDPDSCPDLLADKFRLLGAHELLAELK
jgi:hydroxymethylbilane synthase